MQMQAHLVRTNGEHGERHRRIEAPPRPTGEVHASHEPLRLHRISMSEPRRAEGGIQPLRWGIDLRTRTRTRCGIAFVRGGWCVSLMGLRGPVRRPLRY